MGREPPRYAQVINTQARLVHLLESRQQSPAWLNATENFLGGIANMGNDSCDTWLPTSLLNQSKEGKDERTRAVFWKCLGEAADYVSRESQELLVATPFPWTALAAAEKGEGRTEKGEGRREKGEGGHREAGEQLSRYLRVRP